MDKMPNKKPLDKKFLGLTLVLVVSLLIAVTALLMSITNTVRLEQALQELQQQNTEARAVKSQLSNVQSSVDSLTMGENITTNQLGSLQTSVDTLTTQVNSPVNLYQNCTQETSSCTITSSSGAYREACLTALFLMEMPVS